MDLEETAILCMTSDEAYLMDGRQGGRAKSLGCLHELPAGFLEMRRPWSLVARTKHRDSKWNTEEHGSWRYQRGIGA